VGVTAEAILGLHNDFSNLTQLHGLYSLLQTDTHLLCNQAQQANITIETIGLLYKTPQCIVSSNPWRVSRDA